MPKADKPTDDSHPHLIGSNICDLSHAFDLLATMPSDFMQDGRMDSLPQERETWL